MKKFVFSSVFFVLALGFVSFVRAEDLGVVKARMDQRLAQVDALKAQGAVGENNRGYLEARGAGGDAAAVVTAENKDREVVYAALAEKTGTSADQVGKKRASKIAQNSRPGVWVQDENGNWKQK
jgi:uncharacterized protein YdbL (DUF1318 family)